MAVTKVRWAGTTRPSTGFDGARRAHRLKTSLVRSGGGSRRWHWRSLPGDRPSRRRPCEASRSGLAFHRYCHCASRAGEGEKWQSHSQVWVTPFPRTRQYLEMTARLLLILRNDKRSNPETPGGANRTDMAWRTTAERVEKAAIRER